MKNYKLLELKFIYNNYTKFSNEICYKIDNVYNNCNHEFYWTKSIRFKCIDCDHSTFCYSVEDEQIRIGDKHYNIYNKPYFDIETSTKISLQELRNIYDMIQKFCNIIFNMIQVYER